MLEEMQILKQMPVMEYTKMSVVFGADGIWTVENKE